MTNASKSKLLGNNIDLLWNVLEQQQETIAKQWCVINLMGKELQEAQDTAEKLLDVALAAQNAKREGGDEYGNHTE